MAKDIDPKRLKLRRVELGMSQRELAERSGVHVSKIGHIEIRRLKGRDRETQEALAEALGVSVAFLCGDDAPATPTATPTMPTTPTVAPDAAGDAGAVDDALGEAWAPATHRIVDVLVVRRMMAETGGEVGVDQARALLDAAARLRARGVTPTSAAVAVEVARAALPATSIVRAKKMG